MKALAHRGLTTVGTILFWAWLVVRFAMDWVGRSTFGDDWQQLRGETMPEALHWLFQTPSWVPAICAVALTAWLIWITFPQKNPITAPSAPDGTFLGPELPKIVYSTKWAEGISMMPIQDVACALCGIEQDGFASLPRARAIANDLVGAVCTGWVSSEDAHYALMKRPIGNTSVVISGRPRFPAIEEASISTRIYTPSLLADYVKNHKNLHVDWIPAPEDKSRTVTIEAH